MGERDPRGAPQRGKIARSVHVRFTRSLLFGHSFSLLFPRADVDHSKGNKSTLITRIQEHEENSATPSALAHTPGTIRSASTNVVPPSSKKTSQAASPGIPLAAQPDSTSNFLAIKLPDLSQPSPNAPVQVVSFIRFIFASIISLIAFLSVKFDISLQPYVPDFWNSAQLKVATPVEPELPKLHVVSGSATRYDGGPTYNLEKHQEDDSTSPTAQADDLPASKEVGFWADVCESLGLPRSFSAPRTLSNLAAQAGKDGSQTHSRSLTDEERKGLYILLGIVGGSWLVGGLVNRQTVVAEEHDTQNQH